MATPKQLPLYTIDAFTDKRFSGNPAAVCLDSYGLSSDVMQEIAVEMNISETAFVVTKENNTNFTDGSTFGLRWFTPTTEVPLCGHATLSAAAVLFNCIGNINDEITFVSQHKGELRARRCGTQVTLDFPLSPSAPENISDYKDLIKMILGDIPVEEVEYSLGTAKLLVRLEDTVTRSELEAMSRPSPTELTAVHTGKVKGVIVTVKSTDSNYDFYSRYFAPWVGIPEDSVTGSAHTVLAPYWAKVLHKNELKARQCSPRGGDLLLLLRHDGRLDITGSATEVVSGVIKI